MAIPARVNTAVSAAASATSATTVATAAASVTAGNFLLAIVRHQKSGASTVTGIADTALNTYAHVHTKESTNSPTDRIEVWAAHNVNAHATNVATATFSVTVPWRHIRIVQYSGLLTAAAIGAIVDEDLGDPSTAQIVAPPLDDPTTNDVVVVIIAQEETGTTTWTFQQTSRGLPTLIGNSSMVGAAELFLAGPVNDLVAAATGTANEEKTIIVLVLKGADVSDEAVRVSQLAVEVLSEGSGDLRVSQLAVEVVNEGSGDLRVSQLAIEVVTLNPQAPQRVTQFVVEDLYVSGDVPSRITQFVVEDIIGPPGAPVITDPATDVLDNSAILHGRINPSSIASWGYFRWDDVFPPFANSTVAQSMGAGDEFVPYEQLITGLDPLTTYYFQAISQLMESGELVDAQFGTILSFTTSGELTPSPGAVTQTGVETAMEPSLVDTTQLGAEVAQEPLPAMATQIGVESAQAPLPAMVTQLGVEIAVANPEADTVEGEDLCETADDPVIFSSWRPTVSGERHWFAETPLDDPLSYYGGWKPDRVLSLGDVRRSLSGTDWQYEAGSFTITYADDDYFFRTILDAEPGKYWYKKEIEAYFVTPRTRRVGGVAKKIATGFVDSDPTFDDVDEGMSVSFTCRDRLSIAMGWTQQGQAQLPRRRINEFTLPDAHLIPQSAWHKGAQLIYGESPTVSGYLPPFGYVSAMPMRQSVPLPDMQNWHEFLLSASAIAEVLGWAYLVPSGEAEDGSFVYSTVEENLGDGTEWLVPDTAAWNAMFSTTDNYRDLVGGDGTTRRWTVIYGRGPKADKALAGSAFIAARVRGIEHIGDSTGDVLTDLHDQAAHFLENVVFVEGDGPDLLWLQDPTFGIDDLTILDYVSINALKAQRISEIGREYTSFGVVGHQGELNDVSEWLVRWQSSGDFRVGTNRFWQQGMWAINRFIEPADTTPILDTYEVHVRTFKPSPRIAELVNWTHYRYRKDWVVPDRWHIDFDDSDLENGRDNAQTVNETSMANWGNEKREAEVSFYFMFDAEVMEHTLEDIARRWSETPNYVELEGSLCLMNAEFDVGRYVTLDHWRGIGPAGYVGRPFWVLANTLLPESRRVRLELLDLRDILEDDFSSYANPEGDHLVGPN